MASSKGSNDYNVMADLAARLKGRTVASNTAAASQNKPLARGIDSQSETSEASTTHKRKENIAPATETSSSKGQPAPAMAENSGPSLFGSADQLAAARAFAQSATAGRSKSRNANANRSGSRSSRQRLFTYENSSQYSMASSPHSSPAKSNAGHGPTGIAKPAAAPSPGLRPAAPRAQGAASTASRPIAPPPQIAANQAPHSPAPPPQIGDMGPTQRWNAFTKSPNADLTPKRVDSPQITHAHPASPKKANDVFNQQVEVLPNTPKGPSADMKSVPPHLRGKADAANIGAKAAVASFADPNSVAVASQKESPDAMDIDEPDWKKPTTKAALQLTAEVVQTKDAQDHTTSVKQQPTIKSEKIQQATNGITNHTDKSTSTDVTHEKFNAMQHQLMAMSRRLEMLERENTIMQKQLEAMVQAEERRKYLGTGSSKEPFGLGIKVEGKRYRVQVNAELKVYDLIRRIRVKADLAPAATSNPRIIVGEQAVGHGMTLGEVGITRDAKEAAVVFTYDEA